MKKVAWVGACVVVGLLVAAWGFDALPRLAVLRGLGPQRAADARSPAAVDASTPPDNATPPARTMVANVPLPPRDAALADIYAPLKQRADQGDARAQCRLAFELIRCQALLGERAVLDAYLRKWEAKLDNPEFRAHANVEAARQIAAAERAQDCDVVPVGDLAQGGDYLYRAAHAGVVEAQVRYSQGQMFGFVADRLVAADGNAYLRHPEFERWRREAPGMAQALVDARHDVGLFVVAGAYMHDEQPFEGLYADDPVLAFAYSEIARTRIGRPARPLDQFDAQQRARIADVFRRYPPAQFPDNERELALQVATIGPGSAMEEENTAICD